MRTTAGRCQGRERTIASRHEEIVAQAETYLRAHIDSAVPLRRLCGVVGLSERGLRNAFYSVRGIGPKRWILGERLEGVRRVLSDGGSGPMTVSRVASDYGFFELGRFAATYKETFGEAPSETVRGARRKPIPTPRRTTKGHADVGTSW